MCICICSIQILSSTSPKIISLVSFSFLKHLKAASDLCSFQLSIICCGKACIKSRANTSEMQPLSVEFIVRVLNLLFEEWAIHKSAKLPMSDSPKLA